MTLTYSEFSTVRKRVKKSHNGGAHRTLKTRLTNSATEPLSQPKSKSGNCLAKTRLLDLDDSKLRIQAVRITQLAASDNQKAVLVHDYVK